MKKIGDMLRQVRESHGFSIEAAAGKLRVNKNTLGGYERGERSPDVVFINRFSAYMGVKLKDLVDALVLDAQAEAQNEEEVASADEFFLQSKSYIYSLPKSNEVPRVNDSNGQDDDSEVELAKYDCSGSCGPGNLIETARVIDHVPVSLRWLRREGLKPETTIIIGSKGDSMAPKIPPGAQLMLNLTKRDPSFGGVFAVVYANELFIKYVQRTDEGLYVSSEQSEHNPPRLFRAEEADQIRIEGRVHLVISRV